MVYAERKIPVSCFVTAQTWRGLCSIVPRPYHRPIDFFSPMASINKVILVGNLGRDPEMRTFPSGDQIATVTIATTDRWRDKNTGENRELTEWHRVVFNGKLAEIVAQYLRKGSQVYVEGSIRTRKWTDQQTGQERYSTEIRADTMQMLGSRQGGGNSHSAYADEGYGGYDDAAPPRRAVAPRSAPTGQYAPPQAAPQQAASARPATPAPAPAPTAPHSNPSTAGFDSMDDDDIPF